MIGFYGFLHFTKHVYGMTLTLTTDDDITPLTVDGSNNTPSISDSSQHSHPTIDQN